MSRHVALWRARAVVVFAAAVLGGGCSSTTTPTMLPVTGTWTGTYRVAACTAGVQACFGLKPSYPIRLVLQQTGTSIAGSFNGEIPIGAIHNELPVTGTFDSARTLRISGSQPFQYGGFEPGTSQAGINLTNWSTVMDTGARFMTGTFHLTIEWRGTNAYPDTWQIDAELLSLSRTG